MSWTVEACVLCGSETEPRVMALVEWTEPIRNERWSHVPRCVDRGACRERVELVVGEPWPVNDGTPASSPVVQPVPAAGVPTPDAAKELPWLR